MPTNPERMVWGMGDAAGLRVVDTPAGRLGSLICLHLLYLGVDSFIVGRPCMLFRVGNDLAHNKVA